MKAKTAILALVCMSAIAAPAEWLYNKSTTPLDDSEIHILLCPPTNITEKLELAKPSSLAIHIQNGKPTVAIIASPKFTVENTYPVTIRFDRKKAREIQCLISENHMLLFPPEQKEFMEEILSSDGLIISLDVLLGSRMDFFDLRGLADELKKHNLELFPAPPPEPRDDSAAVTARNEKGSRAFARLSENAREDIAERTRKHAERKLKPKEFKLLDLQRRRHRLGTVWIQHFNADGKKWRTGFLESSGQLTQIDPSKLKTYISNSTPED